MCLSVLWLHYRFPLHIINLMRNYLCHKEHSNDLWLTKSVTCELRTQLIDDVYIQSIVQDSLFTETIFSQYLVSNYFQPESAIDYLLP